MDRKKITTIIVVLITIVLAVVAVFTALRLYQSGQEPVAPTAPSSEPFAWDCSQYTFNMTQDGTVVAVNNSTRDEPSQQAEIYINDELVRTLDVPALSAGENAALGTITTPTSTFSWQVIGTRDCQSSGEQTPLAPACESLAFDLQQQAPSATPTGTPAPSSTPTISSTPSPSPTGADVGGGPTNTPQPSATPTQTQIASNPSATPTSGNLAQANSPTPTSGSSQASPTDTGSAAGSGDQLPDSGFSDPIVLFSMSGLLLILGAFILAL